MDMDTKVTNKTKKNNITNKIDYSVNLITNNNNIITNNSNYSVNL